MLEIPPIEIPSGWSLVTEGVTQKGDRRLYKPQSPARYWVDIPDDELNHNIKIYYYVIRKDNTMKHFPLHVFIGYKGSLQTTTEPLVFINPLCKEIREYNCYLDLHYHSDVVVGCTTALNSLAISLDLEKIVDLPEIKRIFNLKAFAAVCKTLGLNPKDYHYQPIAPSGFKAATPENLSLYCELVQEIFGAASAAQQNALLEYTQKFVEVLASEVLATGPTSHSSTSRIILRKARDNGYLVSMQFMEHQPVPSYMDVAYYTDKEYEFAVRTFCEQVNIMAKGSRS